jgi:hypothetical protein
MNLHIARLTLAVEGRPYLNVRKLDRPLALRKGYSCQHAVNKGVARPTHP